MIPSDSDPTDDTICLSPSKQQQQSPADIIRPIEHNPHPVHHLPAPAAAAADGASLKRLLLESCPPDSVTGISVCAANSVFVMRGVTL